MDTNNTNKNQKSLDNIEEMVYSKDSLLVTDDEIFQIDLYDEDTKSFNKGVAYLKGDYYYVYRGEKPKNSQFLKPGIYKDPESGEYYRIEPTTDEEKERYNVKGKVATLNPEEIINVVNSKNDIIVAVPESSKIFMPSLSNNDDILKRLAKKALILKGVDLDKFKDRFSDKNALFNFKQVIKGDNRLSILIFDRGMDALNLKYTIMVEEKDPNNIIGTPLKEPIVACSEDTFEI